LTSMAPSGARRYLLGMWFWPQRKPHRPRSLREQLEEARDDLQKGMERATSVGAITRIRSGSPTVQAKLQSQLTEVEETLARMDRSRARRY
jgi:hypothetical protein